MVDLKGYKMSQDKKSILKKLKEDAGSHSPSPKEIINALGYNPIEHDFCFLSNPYATDLVVDRFQEVFTNKAEIFKILEAYPANSKYVAKNIAAFEGVDSRNVVVSNGAIQSIEWVCEGWNLKNLLIPTPTFSTYYELLDHRFTFTNDFYLSGPLDSQSLINLADASNSDSILLIHPNNPTGEALVLEELKHLVNNLGDKKLIIDESFSHFLNDYESYAYYRNNLMNKNVVFIKSMSKDFGIAGIRLGYLYSYDGLLLDHCNKKTTWNLNNFSIKFSDLLKDVNFIAEYDQAKSMFFDARNKFYSDLSILKGIKVYKSEANFFLIEYDSSKNPDLVYDMLVDDGVYVRTMADKVGLSNSYIRVAVRRVEENELFIKCFKKHLA